MSGRQRVTWLVWALVLGLLAGCVSNTPEAVAPGPGIALDECQLTTPGVNATVPARCGTLTVPENRDTPEGRALDLNLAVVPAVSRNPQPDPVFILAGGPGQAAVEIFPAMSAAFRSIHQDRDIVLIDQRGTGRSHPLECEVPEDPDLRAEDVAAALKACPATLDADLRFYTTEIAMRDLDAVRDALGYDTINLYGASYGTRAALTYLRLFPDRVRSLVLDGVVSPDYRLYLNTAQDAGRALDMVFDRCAADEACADAFPEARDTFAALLDRLEVAPVTTLVPDPVSAEPVTVTLDREALLNLTFPLLYTPEVVALLPLDLHRASAAGDFAPLVAQASAFDAGLYPGMFYAVACTEDAPFIDPAEAAAGAEGSLFGDMTVQLLEVCEAWPVGELFEGFGTPVVSDVPVLLLSGTADPVTPPRYAMEVSETLPNSLHLVGAGMGHGLMGRGCIDQVVADFVAAGSVAGLDTGCARALAPPPFFVSPTGPRP